MSNNKKDPKAILFHYLFLFLEKITQLKNIPNHKNLKKVPQLEHTFLISRKSIFQIVSRRKVTVRIKRKIGEFFARDFPVKQTSVFFSVKAKEQTKSGNPV